jgi:hypothetical protein
MRGGTMVLGSSECDFAEGLAGDIGWPITLD